MKALVPVVLAAFAVIVCTHAEAAPAPAPDMKTEPTITVVPASEVVWEQLNPARGDASPKAGTLWGDRKGTVATGFLAKFVDGFSSPPHIHNVSYRAVVISGLVHNDDPAAAHMWMPPGSFWTQPKGEVHITAASGGTTMAYVEIESGPYLVFPPAKAFDSDEHPVNIDVSNLVWQDATTTTWVDRASRAAGEPARAEGPKLAFLWGQPRDGARSGVMIKLPAGFSGELRSQGPSLRAVLVQGLLPYQMPGVATPKRLDPGSHFRSTGEVAHRVSCASKTDCLLYARVEGTFEVVSAAPAK